MLWTTILVMIKGDEKDEEKGEVKGEAGGVRRNGEDDDAGRAMTNMRRRPP